MSRDGKVSGETRPMQSIGDSIPLRDAANLYFSDKVQYSTTKIFVNHHKSLY